MSEEFSATGAFSIAQGADRDLKIKTGIDLTGATGYAAVKDSAGTVQITKTTDVAEEGEILDPAEDGIMTIHFIPSDTEELEPGNYKYDAWIVTSDGKRYPVRDVTKFVIKERVVVIE
jgi:hypothetical protein